MYPTKHLSKKELLIKEACEQDFFKFIKVVAPWLSLGHVHQDVAHWIQLNHQQGHKRLLVLLPRGHLKSKIAALYTAWRVIKKPSITILYASASGSLAERQLYDVCNILDGPDVRHYWRGLINPKLSERDLWRNTAINVDHPERRGKGIRDNTIRAMSVGSTITGDHYDLAILDDIIAPNSDADPWTESGRLMVAKWYSQLASVMNPGSELLAVGTRYIGNDIYDTMIQSEKRIYDDHGTVLKKEKLYEVYQAVVETNQQFLWPRSKAQNGEWYGFDAGILDEIKETYRKSGQMEQFYAQYYQNPTDLENPKIKVNFNYYEKENLVYQNGRWHIKAETPNGMILRPLNVFAAMDIAYTTNPKSDFTAIITAGVDSENYRYVLDIDRFKTHDPYVMLDHLFKLYERWQFLKCRVEVTAAQALLIPILQKQMVVRNQRFFIDEYKPLPGIKKEERIMAALSPLYQLQQLYHFRGGLCEELEKQLIQTKPEHDDIADVWAAIQEIMFPPSKLHKERPTQLVYDQRFGGVSDIKYK